MLNLNLEATGFLHLPKKEFLQHLFGHGLLESRDDMIPVVEERLQIGVTTFQGYFRDVEDAVERPKFLVGRKVLVDHVKELPPLQQDSGVGRPLCFQGHLPPQLALGSCEQGASDLDVQCGERRSAMHELVIGFLLDLPKPSQGFLRLSRCRDDGRSGGVLPTPELHRIWQRPNLHLIRLLPLASFLKTKLLPCFPVLGVVAGVIAALRAGWGREVLILLFLWFLFLFLLLLLVLLIIPVLGRIWGLGRVRRLWLLTTLVTSRGSRDSSQTTAAGTTPLWRAAPWRCSSNPGPGSGGRHSGGVSRGFPL